MNRRGFLTRIGQAMSAAVAAPVLAGAHGAQAQRAPAAADAAADPLMSFIRGMAEDQWRMRASLVDVQAVLPDRTRANFDARTVRERLGLDVTGLDHTWPDDNAVDMTDGPPHFGIGRKYQFVSSYTQPAIDRGTGRVYVLGGGHKGCEDGSVVEADPGTGRCRLVTPGASLRRTEDGKPPGSVERGPGKHRAEHWGDVNARGHLAPRAIHGYSFCKAHDGHLFVWGINAGYSGNHSLGGVMRIDIATGEANLHIWNAENWGFWWYISHIPFGLAYDADSDRLFGLGTRGGLMASENAFGGAPREITIAGIGNISGQQWFSNATVVVTDPGDPAKKLYFMHESDSNASFGYRTVSNIPPRGNLFAKASGPLAYRNDPRQVLSGRLGAQRCGWTQDGTDIYRWEGAEHIARLRLRDGTWDRLTSDRPGGDHPGVPSHSGCYFALEFLPRYGVFVAAGFNSGDRRRSGVWIYKPRGWRAP